MPLDEVRHHLPVNSMIFDSQFSLRTPQLTRSTNPTLVNIREAADTSVTALPVPSAITQQKPAKTPPVWRRVLGRVKRSLRFGKRKGPVIGEPRDFQHYTTGGPGPLMAASREQLGAGQDRDSEWEDV
jgi:hypothetical protein